MISSQLKIAAAVAGLVFSSAAAAAPKPLIVPMRDVTVDYQIEPMGHAPVTVHVEIEAGGARLRITSPDLPTTLLVDRQTETAAILLPFLRAYSDVKIARFDPERTVLRGASFNPTGHFHLVGHDCTAWQAQSQDGVAQGCITPDGVILRGAVSSRKQGRLGEITALRVSYGPLPPAVFAIPPDFQRAPFRLNADGIGR